MGVPVGSPIRLLFGATDWWLSSSISQIRFAPGDSEGLVLRDDMKPCPGIVRRYAVNDTNSITNAWIAMHMSAEGSPEYKKHFWAYEELDSLCDVEPLRGLLVIDDIVKTSQDDVVLANLAAGPIEDLLVRHDEYIIEHVVAITKGNPSWHKILRSVWKNSIADEVWDRVQRCIKEV